MFKSILRFTTLPLLLCILCSGGAKNALSQPNFHSMHPNRSWNINSFANINGLLICCTDSGVISSNDSGITWQSLGLDSIQIHAVATTSNGDIFVGGQIYSDLTLFRGVLYKANISNFSWRQIGGTINCVDVNAIIAITSSTILVGCNPTLPFSSIYYSIDGGENWSATNNVQYNINGFASAFNRIFAASDRGLYSSRDFGTTWSPLSPQPSNQPLLCISSYLDSILFIGGYFGVYKTLDTSFIWDTLTSGLSNTLVTSISTINQERFIVGGTRISNSDCGLYYSNDLGRNWLRSELQNIDVQSVYTSPNNYYYAGGFVSFRTQEPESRWQQIADGIIKYSDISGTESSGYLIAGTRGLFVFNRLSESFDYRYRGINSPYVWSCVSINDSVFLAGTGNGIYRSVDQGSNWTRTFIPPIGHDVTTIVSTYDNHLFASVRNSTNLFMSSDLGENWLIVPESFPEQLSINPQKNTIFCKYQYLQKSTDNGNTWAVIWNTYERNFSLHAVNTQGDVYIARTDTIALYRTTNNGVNWRNIGFTDTNIISIVCSVDDDLFVLANTQNDTIVKLYRTINSGNQWQLISVDPSFSQYGHLKLDDDGYLYYLGSDLLRSSNRVTGVRSDHSHSILTDNSFGLVAIYPNPMNGMGFFKVITSQVNPMYLRVFDVQGREVWADRYASPENQTGIPFYANRLATGTYYLKIQQSGQSVVKPFTVLK